jgi:SAM-dependent methyltransferase
VSDELQQGYDRVAERYANELFDELDRKPLDRALLAALAEQLGGGAPVADVGCGPGHVARHLCGLGLAVLGVDLSPGMVALARRRSPHIEFRQGSMLAMPAADGALAGLVAFYSIIHLTPAERPRAYREFARVLRPGGLALLAFHVGSEIRHIDQWWGEPVSLDFHLLQPPDVVDGLEAAGLPVQMQLERLPHPGEAETRRAYILARKPMPLP